MFMPALFFLESLRHGRFSLGALTFTDNSATESGGSRLVADPSTVVAMSSAEKDRLVETRVTCPFVGSAVAGGRLAVRNSAADPLAAIEDVRALGDSGGGDLGHVLALFATGNHGFMRGASGRVDKPAPSGFFSLEFPGSQGAHPGHSGILMGDPATLGSGRLSLADFARLAARAKEGLVTRSNVALFIAENSRKDPNAKVFDANSTRLLGADFIGLGAAVVPAVIEKLVGAVEGDRAAVKDFENKFTKLTGEDNLLGSAGEFGLLFALVANKAGAREVDGEPTASVEDLESMFVQKRLPEGFETWKKTGADWVANTIHLAIGAAKEYVRLGEVR